MAFRQKAPLGEPELNLISKCLDTPHWITIGRTLGLSTSVIDFLAEKHKDKPYHERAFRLLLEWREIHSEKCNVSVLVKALESVGLNDRALQVKKSLSATVGLIQQVSLEDNKVEMTMMEFSTNDSIGAGYHGPTVYKGRFNKRNAAIKEVSKMFASKMENEIRILKKLGHHHCIVKYFGNEEHNGFHYMAFELCLGNLTQYIESNKFSNEKLKPMKLLQQTTEGLAYIHEKQIVHCGIKPVHILISTPDTMLRRSRVVISGFGYSHVCSDKNSTSFKHTYIKGYSGYTPYEMLERHKWDTAADVFSLGCVFYHVITNGDAIFQSDSDVLDRDPEFEIPNMNCDSILIENLIRRMISRSPLKRPSCSQILQSPLFRDTKQHRHVLKNFKKLDNPAKMERKPRRSLLFDSTILLLPEKGTSNPRLSPLNRSTSLFSFYSNVTKDFMSPPSSFDDCD